MFRVDTLSVPIDQDGRCIRLIRPLLLAVGHFYQFKRALE